MQGSKEAEVLDIVDALTTTGRKDLDDEKMKKLKTVIKHSKDLMNYAYYAVKTQLEKQHSEIRYSSLLVINELFYRSKHFRGLLQNDLHVFFELTLETKHDKPLPKPVGRAKELKFKALEFLQAWNTKFGDQEIRLHTGIERLKNRLKLDFQALEERNAEEQRKQERIQKILDEKAAKVQTEMKENLKDLNDTIKQMEFCFQLLIPHTTDDLFSSEDFEMASDEPTSAVETNAGSDNSLRQHGIYDMRKNVTIELKDPGPSVQANEDTSPVIDNLNDLYKVMTKKYLPMVSSWLTTLTKAGNCLDNLKKAIDMKQSIESIFKKYKDMKIKRDVPNTDDNDEDDFVEVEDKEGYEADVKYAKFISPASQPSCSKTPAVLEKAYMWNFKHPENDECDPTSALSTITKRINKIKANLPISPSIQELPSTTNEEKKPQNEELLNKVPILPYDIDLYHWEDEKPVIPEVVKFDSLHNFWETQNDPNENEAYRAAQIASLRTRKIDFSGEFEPVKWSCRAPLPSGKLCPRKDRYKCPFHGTIIKRDSAGKPVDAKDVEAPSTSKTSAPDWQDPQLLKDIETATGVNLKLPPKKGKKREKKPETGLTNIKKLKTSTKARLAKKLEKRHKFYAHKLDDADRKKFNDKFGDQWNYY